LRRGRIHATLPLWRRGG